MADPFSSQSTPLFVPGYALLRCIGRGSYGEVWLARGEGAQFVAVKVVYRKSFDHDRPFERELSGIRKFEPVSRSHPSQVSILRVGVDQPAGFFYYIMELADDAETVGVEPASPSRFATLDPAAYVPKTLKQVLQQRGRLPYSECLDISLALATALDHLHQHGLIHRDIKPANVIFVQGVPKLADIGLVTDVGESISYVGTEGFLPPEGPGTARADVYSLGKVLYEMSTGRDRMDFPELPTLLDHRSCRQELLELNQVFLKACQNDPRRRYQSAQELSADLRLLRSGKSVRRARARQRQFVRVRLLALAILVSVGLLVVINGVLQNRNHQRLRQANLMQSEAERRAESLDRDKTRRLTDFAVANGERMRQEGDAPGAMLWFAKALAVESPGSDRSFARCEQLRQAWLQSAKPALVLAHTNGVNTVRFSADGRRVITAGDDRTARVWTLPAGELVGPPLAHSDRVILAELTPDGERALTLTAAGKAQLWRQLNSDPVATPLDAERPLRKVALRPDARQILGLTRGTELMLWETSSRQLRFSWSLPHPAQDAVFSPDTRLVVGADESGLGQVWSTETGKPAAQLVDLGRGATLLFSPDSRRVATYAGNKIRLYDVRSGFSAPFQLVHEATIRTAAFSPDGSHLLTGGDDHTLRLWDAVTGQSVTGPRLHPAPIHLARFSPDGRFIATASGPQLRLWHATSNALAAPVELSGEPINDLCFSPAGHLVARAGADGASRAVEVAPPALTNLSVPSAAEFRSWMEWAELLASRRLVADAGLVPLSSFEQRALWLRLLPPSGDLAAAGRSLVGWHQGQARRWEDAESWFAALFHWERGARLDPGNAVFRAGVARAMAALPAREAEAVRARAPDLAQRIPPRPAEASPRLIDLAARYNATLTESWLPTNVVAAGNDLAELPAGIQRLGGTAFDVRGVIQLSGAALETAGGRFPKEVRGIAVNQRCRRLHFLHGSAWSALSGVQVGTYRVRYAQGDSVEIRIVYGRHVREWWSPATSIPLTPGAVLAWEGSNAATRALGMKVRLYQMTWTNPRPDAEIATIDFVSSMENAAPFLIAVTTE